MELGGLLEGDLELDLLVVGAGEDVVPPRLEGPEVVLEVHGAAVLGLLDVVVAAAQQVLDLGAGGLQFPEDLHEAVKLILGSLWQAAHRFGTGQRRVDVVQPGEHVLDLLVEGLGLLEGVLELELPALSLGEQVVPLGVELVQLGLSVGRVARVLLGLDDLAAGIVQRVDGRLVSLDVVHHDLELGQLDLDDLRIAVDGFEAVQGLVGPVDPDQELVEGVLELSKSEESLLQLLLTVVDALVEFVPPAVDIGQGLLDGASLVGRGVFR